MGGAHIAVKTADPADAADNTCECECMCFAQPNDVEASEVACIMGSRDPPDCKKRCRRLCRGNSQYKAYTQA